LITEKVKEESDAWFGVIQSPDQESGAILEFVCDQSNNKSRSSNPIGSEFKCQFWRKCL